MTSFGSATPNGLTCLRQRARRNRCQILMREYSDNPWPPQSTVGRLATGRLDIPLETDS